MKSKSDTISKLLQEFSDNVVAQTEAIMRGDARAGNRHADRYLKALSKLLKFGNEGRDALAPLMQDRNPDIRSMAAAVLLRYRHVEARAVLEELARGEGIIAFECQETLKRWDEGGIWYLDPG